MIKRRPLIVLIALAVLVLGAPLPWQKRVNLTFWSWRTEDVQAYEKFIAEFNSEYPISMWSLSLTGTPSIIPSWLQLCRQAQPGHHSLAGLWWMEPLAKAGYLMLLDDEIPALKDFGRSSIGRNQPRGW